MIKVSEDKLCNNVKRKRHYTEEQRIQERKRARDWRINNPERYKKMHQDYYQEHKEEWKIHGQNYYQTHKEEISVWGKDYHQKHKVHRNEYDREWKRKLREILRNEIGSKCVICGKEPKVPIYHEKNFKPHLGLTSKHSGESNPKYILDHKEDFVPLCRLCHTTLHRVHNYLEKFKQLLIEHGNSKQMFISLGDVS